MPLARRSKKASFPAAAWRCCARRKVLKNAEGAKATSRSASTSSRRACEEPVRQIVGNAGYEGAIVVEKIRANNDPNFGFNAASTQLRRPGEGRRHRSHQGDPLGSAERFVDRGADADHRSHDREIPEKKPAPAGGPGGHGPEMDY